MNHGAFAEAESVSPLLYPGKLKLQFVPYLSAKLERHDLQRICCSCDSASTKKLAADQR
jgi:hypothetical protein